MKDKPEYIVSWIPVDGGKESSFVRLGHRMSIEVMR